MVDVRFDIWMCEVAHLPPRRILEAREHFGTAEQACRLANTPEGEAFFKPEERQRMQQRSLKRPQQILEACRRCGARAVSFEDAAYPAPLRSLYDPPAVLYVRGTLPDFEKEPSLSIVGQRRATPRGLETAQRFAHVLSAHGFVIVSGLALGIDSAGHRGALEGPAPTVAVFGTAIDVCYPAAHNGLLRQILEEGAAVSEYPPGTHSLPHFFLHRNLIISGLTLGTLVVEAPRHSGSLNTAASAMNQGRDVFAVPGCIDLPEYEGSNALLRDGAILCTSPVEICREYAARYPGMVAMLEEESPRSPEPEQPEERKEPQRGDLTEAERMVVKAIQGRTHIDAICQQVPLPVSQVLTALTMLQIKQVVKERGAKYFEIL